MKMLIFDFRGSEKAYFENHKFPDIEITFFEEPLNNNTILSEEQLVDTDIISVFISSSLTEDILKRFRNLRVITTRSTGYNHIDIKYCIEHNIAVFNVAKYGKESVAQYTLTLILALVRNLIPAYNDMRSNIIDHTKYESENLKNLTIGIIGCGSVGCAVAKMVHDLGMNVLVCSYAKNESIEQFVEYVSLKQLLSNSDVITLHLPFVQESYHLIGENEFKLMKDKVCIVNTARGELIDIVALYQNLLSGKVKGAALDVLECEYIYDSSNSILEDIKENNDICVKNALITQKLFSMDNVIITPHIAYNTLESINYLLETTFMNILDYTKGINTNRVC